MRLAVRIDNESNSSIADIAAVHVDAIKLNIVLIAGVEANHLAGISYAVRGRSHPHRFIVVDSDTNFVRPRRAGRTRTPSLVIRVARNQATHPIGNRAPRGTNCGSSARVITCGLDVVSGQLSRSGNER